MVDGLDNNERSAGFLGVRPSIDGIEEIRVVTSNYPAELGRAAGAVVNVITKSGTNDFHGTAYEYLRNEDLNARSYFANTGRKPEYRQNQFGGSVGGPIVKNRTFFFGDIEELRIINSATSVYTVPTAFEETNPGNFSDIGGPTLPTAALNSIGLDYFDLYPTPTYSATTVNNFQGTSRGTQNGTTVDARVDEHLTANDLFFARYAYNPVTTFTPSALPTVTLPGVNTPIQPGGVLNGQTGHSNTTAQNIELGYTRIFTPTLLIELKAGYTRYDTLTTPLNYGKNIPEQLGMTGVNLTTVPETSGMSLFYPIGYAELGDAIYLPLTNIDNTYQLNGSISYVRGRHTIKSGAALIRRQSSLFQSGYGVGLYAFSAVPGYFANALEGMLVGTAVEALRQNQLTGQTVEFWEPSVYVQDDWRAKQNLTLNLGLRYEVYPAETEKHNQISNFDLNTLQMVVATPSNRNFGIGTGYGNFSPRLGFDLSLPRQSVIRGAFGLTFYPADIQSSIELPNVPFAFSNTSYFQGVSSPLAIPAAISPATFASNPNISSVDSKDVNFRTAYIEEFSLMFQKQFGANVASIGYIGQLGRRLLYIGNDDLPLPPGAGNPTPNYKYQTQLPYLTDINYYNNGATSSYHAMQAQLQRRTTKGLTINANYTYARGLSNTFSGSGANGPSGVTSAIIPSDPRYDYGNSDLDIRNRFAASIDYELPFGKDFTGVKRVAFSGWQANTIAYWQTGLPFTVIDSVTPVQAGSSFLAPINLPGVTADRPNMLHSAKLPHPTLQEYFDTTAFAMQTIGTAGNEHRNQIYGPHDRRMDLSLFKNFPIHEQLSMQFRAECFNILNIANFATPNNSITAFNTNGTPSTTNTPFGTISSTAANETQGSISSRSRWLFERQRTPSKRKERMLERSIRTQACVVTMAIRFRPIDGLT